MGTMVRAGESAENKEEQFRPILVQHIV